MSTNEGSMPHANISTTDSPNSGRIQESGSQFHFPGGYFTKEQYDQALFTGEVIGIDKEEEGPYILKQEVIPVVGTVVKDKKLSELRLWHLRLGHPSMEVMKHISILKNNVDETV